MLVIIIALAAVPFLFKDKIKELVAKTINENVDAKVSFEDVRISACFKNFPNASVTIVQTEYYQQSAVRRGYAVVCRRSQSENVYKRTFQRGRRSDEH